jgi:hypothetical protein
MSGTMSDTTDQDTYNEISRLAYEIALLLAPSQSIKIEKKRGRARIIYQPPLKVYGVPISNRADG